ncbi:MAG: hypothetical protein QG650_478 [Patescibacteria group bacterium]|nr:hypothetical protein [Patescibacteria group bacterium]
MLYNDPVTVQHAAMGFVEAFTSRTGKPGDQDAMMASSAPKPTEIPAEPSSFSGVRFIEDVFSQAVRMGASDVHLEPTESGMRVRLRIDGHFVELTTAEEEQKAPIVARVKILAGLKIDETRLPQDGKANFIDEMTKKEVDMRVSSIPTIYGEKIVVRLLKKQAENLDLRSIGMLPMNMVKIKQYLKSSYGLILVVGPTGSGKSTTLYSMLSSYDTHDRNISTLEDPVEYRIPGVNHTQINSQIGFSFAEGLRSLLRQDPDILMVGEIRDSETAHLAVEASITGHLVFSTIHANSTVNTLQRLTNLGIDPLLVISSLKLIISQRLARTLCPHCKISYKPEIPVRDKIVARIGRYLNDKENFLLYRVNPEGCEKCGKKGHKGRTGFFEVLEMTEGLEKLVLSRASKTQLEIQAIGDGMISMRDDALFKAVLGEVSLEEVLHVIGT